MPQFNSDTPILNLDTLADLQIAQQNWDVNTVTVEGVPLVHAHDEWVLGRAILDEYRSLYVNVLTINVVGCTPEDNTVDLLISFGTYA